LTSRKTLRTTISFGCLIPSTPGSVNSTAIMPSRGPRTLGGTRTIPVNTVGSQTAPTVLGPKPAWQSRDSLPRKAHEGSPRGCRRCTS
jgi:hypothetical protein